MVCHCHGHSQNFWLGGPVYDVPMFHGMGPPPLGPPNWLNFFSHKWLVWCVEPFQGRNYRGVLDVKTCCMPKIAVFCTPPPCKNWEGRTTYTTYVTASPFYLLGEDLSTLALFLVSIFSSLTDFSPQFSFTEPDESSIIHSVLVWTMSVAAQLTLGQDIWPINDNVCTKNQ